METNQPGERQAPPDSTAMGGGEVVMALTDCDVLLGRGAPCKYLRVRAAAVSSDDHSVEERTHPELAPTAVDHKGNIQFREIVSSRRQEYLEARKRQHKDWIARQVMSAVASRGGRFLRKIESLVEAEELGVPAGVSSWRVADENTILQKIKQALRDRDWSSPSKKRKGSQDLSPGRDNKKLASESSQSHILPVQGQMPAGSAGLISSQGGGGASAGEASEASGDLNTALLLRESYSRLQSERLGQPRNIATTLAHIPSTSAQGELSLDTSFGQRSHSSQRIGSSRGESEQARTALALRDALSNLQHGGAPQAITGGNTASGNSLESLLALLPRQGQSGLSGAGASFLGQQVSQQIQGVPGRFTATLGSSDRLRRLLSSLRGPDTSTIGGLQQGIRDRSESKQADERIPARLTLTRNEWTSPGQSLDSSIPTFFSADPRAETTGCFALRDSTNLETKGQNSICLSFSLTEMLVLFALCSFGVPTFNPAMLDSDEMFAPKRKPISGSRYEISWYDFSLLLQQAAKDWRDMQNQKLAAAGLTAGIRSQTDVEKRAHEICSSYTLDCRRLAKTSLCVLEKLRFFLKAMDTEESPLDGCSLRWMEGEIKRWTKTLNMEDTNGFPLSYTTYDYLVAFPDHKENSALKLVSQCGREACTVVWRQIVSLSHIRYMVSSVPPEILSVKLEKSVLLAKSHLREDMPRWWLPNSSHFDVELIKTVLLHGYVGVLGAPISLPPSISTQNETMTLKQAGVSSKQLMQNRLEQLATVLAITENETFSLPEDVRLLLNRRRMEERIQALQSLL